MNFYDWKNGPQTCAKCGWAGLGKDAEVGETFDTGAEYHCPKCNEYFGFRSYPTHEETLSDPRADPVDKKISAMILSRIKGKLD